MAKPSTSTKSKAAPKADIISTSEPISANTSPVPAQTAEPVVPKTAKAQPAKKTQPKPAATKAAATPKRAQSKPAPRKLETTETIVVSRDDVALRAYFISESRREQGFPGDEHQDWIEAERQIVTESATKAKLPQS